MSNITFVSHGELKIQDMNNLTLDDIETFCAEARRLGVSGQQKLYTNRQGLLGPTIGWYFPIPVIPKVVEDEAN